MEKIGRLRALAGMAATLAALPTVARATGSGDGEGEEDDFAEGDTVICYDRNGNKIGLTLTLQQVWNVVLTIGGGVRRKRRRRKKR